MWPNNHPPSRASPGDHFNNNTTVTNPYSRNASTPKGKQGRQSTDPWDWGREDSSAQHDDWNSGWNQNQTSVPNVIPTSSHLMYHPPKPEGKAHGTPDLIPEKVNNVRGDIMKMGHQHYNQVSNASDFFENFDLAGQNYQMSQLPLPSSYSISDPKRPLQQPISVMSSTPYPEYQVLPPQSTENQLNTTHASYFSQPQSSNPVSNNPTTYYQQPAPAQTQNLFQTPQYYQPERNTQLLSQEYKGSYYNQSTANLPEHSNYKPSTLSNSGEQSQKPTANSNAVEVENIEIVPPEQNVTASVNHSDISKAIHCNQSYEANQENNFIVTNENNIPDNQETVPDNEEHILNLPEKLSQMKIGSSKQETWSSSAGWENQEVAPRCELDRNQYLETGQFMESTDAEEVPFEAEINEEVEALPPPGLHRMVTGQGTESISQRSVLGQPPSMSQTSGFSRLVHGQPTLSGSPEPMTMERLVPGQQNNEDITVSSSHRMVPGHQSQGIQRFSIHQESQESTNQRLVTGQIQSSSPASVRMIPGQLSDDENNVSTSEMERMIPVGVSEHESSFPGDIPDDERMVPGGMSDDSRSQSISIDDETQNSSDRMIPGMTEPHSLQASNHNERLVTGAGSGGALNPSSSSQEGNTHGGRNDTSDINQPPLGLHRLVLGQMNTEANGNSEHTTAKSAEALEEKKGGNPPPGMHRMVLGQFREKEPEPENEKEKEPIRSVDREDDSDSDNRSYRRRHRHRRESYDDERKERDYSSEREYRGKREDRREYKKKRDNSFNRSPEYRSDHEDYDRNDYRDRRERDRDRRDRPRDRERRRRSPDYSSYDPYYRDDPRKLHPRDRDRRYYEPYEDDPYYYRENRSRPSSRSGSDYRRHRDYPPRQPYYPEQGGVSNYMHYYQMQQYYENMRRTDPQAYALWYERYMAEKFGTASNDRASVHSGRSSANENSQLHENDEEDGDGVKADDAVSHRSTPPLYTSAHIRGQFNMLGQLIVVNPQDPFSYGEHHATVTLCKIAGPNVADSADTLEFLQNPGPFISGVTHKNTVLQYLKKQSDQLSHSSGKLLYGLIRLVIKLNGIVDMTDVADLLMESYRKTTTEGNDFRETSPVLDETTPLSPHEITAKFRDLLLEGNKTEALEWAMKHKDWGHALFLASKMDSRTHNNVMLRFANGLQNNDPLQTLYQLMSGREPQAATCASDKKWGDWRPHLAMMLSNQTSNLELDRKAILTLGDSLASRGRLFASHFCYLTAQLEFSNYSDRQAKLVLLGASPDKPFSQFATCRAIMLTLCYEYAKQLSNKDWCIPTLRPYKFMLACQLFDHGNLTAALSYLEWLAQDIVRLPHREDKSLIQLIIDMADKIKCVDTTLAYASDPCNDPEWLVQLKYHIEETNDPNYCSKHLTHGISTSTVSDLEPSVVGDSLPQPVIRDGSLAYQPETNSYQTDTYTNGLSQTSFYDNTQNSYYNPQHSMQSQEIQQIQGYSVEQNTTVDNSSLDYWSANANTAWDHQQQLVDHSISEQPNESAPADPQPQISVKPGFGYYATSEEVNKSQIENQTATVPPKKPEVQEKSNRRANKTQQSGPGWFGGIWDKLALRPKNQMKLPDDKNPPIVWDEKTKKWVNTDSTEEEQSAQLKPPPKASDLSSATVSATPSLSSNPTTVPTATGSTGLPPPATTANKYKLQRGKGMRGNYVDVMGNNSKSASSSSSNPAQAFPTMPQAPVTNFFVPASVPGNENAPLNFLSPSGPVSYEPSSLKHDDQPSTGGYGKAKPSFFNPGHHKS